MRTIWRGLVCLFGGIALGLATGSLAFFIQDELYVLQNPAMVFGLSVGASILGFVLILYVLLFQGSDYEIDNEVYLDEIGSTKPEVDKKSLAH